MNINLIQRIKNHSQGLSLKKLEKIFFALFLLSIPIQTRLTLITPETYSNGTFNEYATFFLYLSDILFITTLILFSVNTLTFKDYFSIIKNSICTYPRLIPIFTLLITLITWSFVNILWSEYKNIAFYQSIKLTEFALLFIYIIYRLQWFGLNTFIALIFISGFFQSLIGITQYYLQKSLGLKIFMESVLSTEIPNVAKIVVNGEKIIRAYGTFPHPNVFSGFLILSIFCGIWLLLSYKPLKLILFGLHTNGFVIKLFHACPPKLTCLKQSITPNNPTKLFHVKQFQSIRRKVKQFYLSLLNAPRYSTNTASVETSKTYSATTDKIDIGNNINNQIVSRETIYYVILSAGVSVQLIALILTFSRTAWFILILVFIIFIILTINSKLFHVKQFTSFIFKKTNIILLISIVIPILIIININWGQIHARITDLESKNQQSIDYRILYNDIAINIIKEYPLTGTGGKNFTLQMQTFSNKPIEWWQFQPAHNIYLLITSELGIIGLIIFLIFIYLIIKTTRINKEKPIVSSTFVKTTAGASASFETTNLKKTTNQCIGKQIVSRETICTEMPDNKIILAQIVLLSILSGFLLIGLFDHYFWTLQQGQLAFWLVLGAISSINILPIKN